MKIIKLLFIALLFAACSPSPQPIEYGSDACHFCDMTIVDREHSSQLVTSKGKAYKYDAIECMVHSLQDEFQNTEMAHYLVADFGQPGKLIDAVTASYLVSKELRSPMGANLSAFANENAVKKDRKSTRLNSSHVRISYAVFC